MFWKLSTECSFSDSNGTALKTINKLADLISSRRGLLSSRFSDHWCLSSLLGLPRWYMLAEVLFKEAAITTITPIIVWPEAKVQGGNTVPPINRNWVKDSLSPTHQSKNQNPPQPVHPIRKLSQASYPYPSDGRQTMKPNYRKLTKLITWTTALSNSKKIWAMAFRAPKMDGSWWRVLTKHGPLEKGMANHFSILALITPWTVWKGKQIWHWKMNSSGQ